MGRQLVIIYFLQLRNILLREVLEGEMVNDRLSWMCLTSYQKLTLIQLGFPPAPASHQSTSVNSNSRGVG